MKDIKILYLFENYGAPAPEFVLENHLWVDVGNALKDGAFDHHQDKRFPCSFQTIVENTEFSKKAIEYVKAHEIPEVVIHVHKYPDIDCISSVFLLQKMLEKQTTNLKELFSERTLESLCKYVSAIDAGKKKDLTAATLYAYWMRLKDVVEEENKSQAWILKKGIQLFEEVACALEKAEAEIDLFHRALSEYIPVERLEEPTEENSERNTEYYRKIQEIQKKEWADYESDKKKGILKFEKIQMLNKKTGQIDKITAGIWTQMPTGKNGYYYARKYDNCMLTVFPTSIRNERDVPEATTEVIISLNPDMEGYKNYSLLVLAEVLEQLEQIEEEHYLSENGIYKRNHNRSRSKEGRFSKEPFAPTDDPWFITAEEDMIAVPREGSLIPYQRICTLVQSISNVIKTLEIVRYQNESEALVMKKDKYEHITFGELYEITRNKILNIQKSEKTEYLFVYAEIDSAVLKYSNVLLRECCLNMVGKSFPNRATDKILDIDYRTCLYTDRSITILAAAESTELERRGLMSEKLEDSKICQDIWLLLKRRKQLSDIGNHLAEKMQLIYDEADEISNFNTRLVRLNAEMEKDDLITDSLEQEIYFFMKNILGIDRLRASVNTSAELVIQNAEHQNEKAEKARDERTQRILGIVSILAVVSAMLDAKELLGELMGGGWKAFLDPNSLLCYVELTIVIIGVLGVYWTLIAPWWENHRGRIRKK